MNRIKTTIREIVRHLLYRTGAYGLLYRRRKKEGRNVIYLKEATLKSRFKKIYETGVWQHGVNDETPGSGGGSTLAATTELRGALPVLLEELNAKTLIDIGCGDFTWMQSVNIVQGYIGMDIVDSVIKENERLYGRPGRKFLVGDATIDDIPDGDIVMCREVLFHLSFYDINRLLKNVFSKERSYFMATSDRQTLFNSDIPSGDFRLLNLEARPLKFPPPGRIISDAAVSRHRIIGVWDANSIASLFL
jgi:hypothetical protein